MKNNITVQEKINYDDAYGVDNGQSSITNVYELLIELITNVDDAYERIEKENKNTKLHKMKPCRIEYKRTNDSSFINCLDKATGMNYEDVKQCLRMGDKKNSGEASRGFWSRGLKEITSHGMLRLKSIKDNKYTEITFSLAKGHFESHYRDYSASKEQRKDLGLKHNENGTRIEFELFKNTLASPNFHQLEMKLKDHFMLHNILKENHKSLDLTLINLNEKNSKPVKPTYCPPIKLNEIYNGEITSSDISEHVEYYKENGNLQRNGTVKFELYEIEEDSSSLNDYSVCGIKIEGFKEIYDKNFFKIQGSGGKTLKKLYGVLKTELLDSCKDYWKKNATTNNFELNPRKHIEPTRRHGLIYDHPLIDAIIKKPKRILKKHIEKVENQTKGKEIHHSATKLKRQIEDLIAEQLKDLDEEFSSENISKIDNLKNGQWVAMISPLMIDPEERKKIYVYTNISSINLSDKLHISISDTDQKYLKIHNFSSRIEKTKHNDKIRFSFELEGIAPKSNIQLNFKLNDDNSLKTQAIVHVKEYINRVFVNELEFENQNYTVPYNGIRKIKVFADSSRIADGSTVNVTSFNQENVRVINETFQLNQFKNTNYLIGTFQVQGKKHGGKSVLNLDLNGTEYAKEILVGSENEPKSKHDYSIDFDQTYEGDLRYYWGGLNSNTLYIIEKQPAFKNIFGASNTDEIYKLGKDSIEGKVIFCEILSKAVSIKRMTKMIQNSPEEFRDSYGIIERAVEEENHHLRLFYDLFFKSDFAFLSLVNNKS